MFIVLIVFMYALWSSVFSVGKIVLELSPPIFLTGFRMTFAGMIILLYLFFTKRFVLKLSGKQYLYVLLIAIFNVYLGNVLEFWGLKYLSAAKTCFIYGLSPFFAALFSYLHFKEKMNLYKCLGLIIGFMGFIPVLLYQTDGEGLFVAFSFISWPVIAIIGSAICSIYGWVLFRLIVKNNDISPIMINGVTMLVGGVIAFLHSFVTEAWDPFPVSKENVIPFLQGAFIIMVISNFVCYNLYGLMLKRFTTTFLSFFSLLSPIFASFNGWFLLNETLSLSIFLCSGIVSIGLWMVYRAELKQGYILANKKALLSG